MNKGGLHRVKNNPDNNKIVCNEINYFIIRKFEKVLYFKKWTNNEKYFIKTVSYVIIYIIKGY